MLAFDKLYFNVLFQIFYCLLFWGQTKIELFINVRNKMLLKQIHDCNLFDPS